MNEARGPLLRYGMAIAAVVVVTAVRTAFDPWLGDAFPLTALYGAVALAVWYGGVGPAVLASVIGYLAGDYLFIPPRGTPGPVGGLEWLGLGLHVVACGIIIGFGAAARNARRLARQQMDELRRRDEDTRRIMDVTPAAVWIAHDSGCREITGNQMATALTVPGAVPARPAEATMHCLLELDEEGLPLHREGLPLERAVSTGRPVNGVVLDLVVPGREPVSMLGNAAPLFDGDGAVRGAVAAFTDVSELRRSEAALREKEEWLRLALDAGRLGTFLYDYRTCTVVATAQYKELLGFAPDSTPSVDALKEHIHPEDLARITEEWRQSVVERRRTDIEYRVRASDGSWRWISLLGHATYDESGEPHQVIGVVMDVTPRKRAEEQLRDDDRRKDEFLAIMAHELRNPLAPIRNAAAVLGALRSLEPELLWARDVIERQVDAMARLLDDLLDVSRITRKRLELRRERVRLALLVQRGLETSRPLLEAAGHQLTVTLPASDVWLDADPLRASQALANLLNNAARYTDPGGRIRLIAERHGDEVAIRVEDDGIGIAPEALPRIFDTFYQASSPAGRPGGGLGIGLSLVRGIVEAHGGRVEARSAGPGLGSSFLVHLPVLAAEGGSDPALGIRASRTRATRLRILVADDNLDGLESLAMMLRIAGHEIHTARDGVEAVEAAARVQPQVMLMDLGMPRLDGCAAARRIREEHVADGAVMVAITGWGRSEDRQRAREAGFDHHLVKPFEPEVLTALLERISTAEDNRRGAGAAAPAGPVAVAEAGSVTAIDFKGGGR